MVELDEDEVAVVLPELVREIGREKDGLNATTSESRVVRGGIRREDWIDTGVDEVEVAPRELAREGIRKRSISERIVIAAPLEIIRKEDTTPWRSDRSVIRAEGVLELVNLRRRDQRGRLEPVLHPSSEEHQHHRQRSQARRPTKLKRNATSSPKSLIEVASPSTTPEFLLTAQTSVKRTPLPGEASCANSGLSLRIVHFVEVRLSSPFCASLLTLG